MTPEFKARLFAIAKHKDQKYGEHPYIYHLDMVAGILPMPGNYVVLAYLHDILEDTDTTFEELAQEFGEEIAIKVQLLTDPDAPTRKERKELLHTVLGALGDDHLDVLMVKIADRLVNVQESIFNNSSLLKRYIAEHSAFVAAVYRKPIERDLNFMLLKTVMDCI